MNETKTKTYIVHGHFVRADGRMDTFWTRTGLSRTVAYRLAKEQRDAGGVARVEVAS